LEKQSLKASVEGSWLWEFGPTAIALPTARVQNAMTFRGDERGRKRKKEEERKGPSFVSCFD